MIQTTEADLVVSQEDRDLRVALEKHAFADRFGAAFLTDDVLLILAAYRQRAMTQAADAAYLRGVEDAAKVLRSNAEMLQRSAEGHPDRKLREFAVGTLLSTEDALRNLTSGERDG